MLRDYVYWVVTNSMCPLSINRKILLISLAKYTISGHSNTETDFFPYLFKFVWIGFRLIIFIFQKSMQIVFTDRALPTIRRMDKILSLSPHRPKTTVAYAYLPTIPLSAELLLDFILLFHSLKKYSAEKKKAPHPTPCTPTPQRKRLLVL